MSDADVPRDPWGNPVPDGVRPPVRPPASQDPDVAATSSPPATPAPPTDPAWPGRSSAPSTPPPSTPPPPTWPGPSASAPQPTPSPSAPAAGGWNPGAWPPPPPPPQRPRVAGTAIAALVCGIASIVCVGILGVVLGPTAIALGVSSRRTIGRSNGWRTGDGLSTAGIVCGIIGTILGIAYLVFLIRNPDFLTDILNDLTTTTTTGKLQGA